MESLKDKVAIVGMGCTQFGELWEKSEEDLIVEAAYEAYEDAGIDPKRIQAAWLGNVRTAMRGSALAIPLKLDYIPVTRVENQCCAGTDAFRNACFAIAAGVYDIVLVIGFEKLKDGGPERLTARYNYPDIFPQVPIGLPAQEFALKGTRYFHDYGLSFEEGKKMLSRIAVKNHHNGTMSPKAQFRREITLEQAMKAPMIATPLGLLDACGVSDGAAAAIITRPELAKEFRDDYILVKGIGLACGPKEAQLQAGQDFIHFEENIRAAQAAYREAGITDPLKEIGIAELHDCFTITEAITYEDLGFCPRGKAKEFVEAGVFDIDGELGVNTDGGLKCFGHPLGASGIRMIYEIYKQMQYKAGQRQRKKVRLGLTHNLGGTTGSYTVSVAIFGQKD
ncbi:MAG TPA: acetyl-CoA acetyltransferase [Syntrophorhabdaceae bacterium]|nr:acetyl-CoA acetyltransferase [Syntrophorhabdaceae bacterium]